MILTDYLLQKLNKPGLWFVCSEHPASELIKYVYDFAVELGVPVVVYSDIPQKEIQNSVIDLIKTKCIENAENENERDWLEQGMDSFGTTMFSLMNSRFFRSQTAFLTCILLITCQSYVLTMEVIIQGL